MNKTLRAALPLGAVCAAAVFCCLLCYQYDNKYTAYRLRGASGAVTIDERTLAEHPAVLLVDGWEAYGGRLLSPYDLNGEIKPDKIIYIGQHSGFEGLTPDGSPHGSVTYRLLLDLPETPRVYMLELPEIFSAYRAYANGAPLARMGEPSPESYRPETLNTSVTFTAGGRTELVFAVSDFSHLYSGMVYPPAFGLPDAVSQLLAARFLFRALLCASALTIGLLSVLIGILGRRLRTALLYGLLCLFFMGYAAYPLGKTFFSGYYPFYAFENFSFCAMLTAAGLLLRDAAGIKGWRGLVFPLAGCLVCAASVGLHVALTGGGHLLPIIYGYSWLIMVFEWVTAAYLTFLSVRSVWKGLAHSKPILIGVIIFDTALVMDRLLPLHEPVITGWFPELASFALVLCIGAAAGIEIAEQYTTSAMQTERARSMENLLQARQSYYTVLDEKIENTRALRHDLRHHVSMLDGLIAGRQYAELAAYLSGFKQDIDASAPKEYSRNRVVNVLAHYYGGIAAQQNTRFELHCNLSGEISIADADFSALLCNLTENAIEACGRMRTGERYVRVAVAVMGSMLNIRVINSADAGAGRLSGDENRFESSKAEGKAGYGLYSIRMVAKKYNGQSETVWDKNTGVFTHNVTLFL